MKIPKIIIFFPSIEKGGADKNLFMISNFLSNKFKDICIITSSKNCLNNLNKKIQYIGPGSLLNENFGRNLKTFICIYYLLKTLIFNKNSVVLSFQSNLFSILICRFFFVKIITRSNSFPNDWTKSAFKKIIFKKLYQLANLTIVNSLSVKKKFKKIYNIKSTHIYNPINKLKIIKLSKKNNFKFSKKKKILKLIMVARLSREKDHITFLKSLKLIKNRINFQAIILGSGELHNEIKSIISNFKLEKKIKIINYKKNPYPLIKNSDILVLCSLHEGLPNILIEATLLKTFIISSNCETGPKEILLNGKAGGLFKVRDYKDLAQKIVYFSNNKKQRKKMIQYGLKNLDRFDYNKNLKEYYSIIKSYTN